MNQSRGCLSEPASEDIHDTSQGLVIPLHGHCPIGVIIPVAGPRDVESAVSLLHDDAVGDVLEVLVDGDEGF